MKTNLKRLAIACCLFGMILQLHSQGYLIANGVSLYPGNATGPGSMITVIQNPTNIGGFVDYTGFNLDPQGSNTFLFNPFVDEGVRTFLVSPNDPISLQPILSQTWTELLYPNSYIFKNGVPFYLGFYTGYAPQNGIYNNPVFGWGSFVNNQGVIQMLDSALEIEGGGIYAGTQIIIPIPEPCSFALGALGASLLGLGHWRAFNQTKR